MLDIDDLKIVIINILIYTYNINEDSLKKF